MGVSGEGQMITHQAKKMTEAALLAFRDRFELPLTDEQVHDAEYYKPPDDSPEMQYLRERRAALGGSLPARRRTAPSRCRSPPLELFKASSRAPASARSRRRWPSSGSSPRCCATRSSARDVVPIVPDESRTFGMEGLFRQVGIYSPVGQLYTPAGRRAADVLPGGPARPDPRRRASTRPGAMSSFDRRRHVLLAPTTCR